jgi:hypothetical protein
MKSRRHTFFKNWISLGRRWTPALRQRLLAQSANIWCRFFRKNAEVVLTPALLFDRKALT